MCVCDCYRCFLSLRPAVLTFYIPSSLLIVFCTATITHAFCTLSRRQSVEQPGREQVDAKLGLLSVTSSDAPSTADRDHVRPNARTLTVLTLILVFGVFSWACAAAATVLERRTLAGTVVACFYAVCSSIVAILLIVLQPTTSSSVSPSSKCPWTSFTQSGFLKQLTRWRNFNDRMTAGSAPRQPPSVVAKQVVYSIASSATPAYHVCTTPTIQAGDSVDYVADDDMVVLGMRDCTGSSCSVPASLSASQLPVSVGECKECEYCRSLTDGSTNGRCISRNSTRMRDFDDLSWSSDDDNYDGYPEGRWWNGEVDVDGCSIHRAPCPSPASRCSSHASNYDGEDRCSESGLSQQRAAAASSSDGRCKRRWSADEDSPVTSRKTQQRRRDEDGTGYLRYKRQLLKSDRRRTAGSERARNLSAVRYSPCIAMRHKRRRFGTKPGRCDV